VSFTKRTTALCRKCGGETKQIVRGGRSVPVSAFFEEEGVGESRLKEFRTDLAYELYECCSCEYIDLRSSRDLSGATGFTVTFHPQRSSRSVPGWRNDLPRVFTPVLDEVYAALGADCRVLALMGVRAVIDVVVRAVAPGIVSFRGGLTALEELGLLRASDRELVWNAMVLDAQSVATPLHSPTLETLNRVMDVLEDLLHAVYVTADGALVHRPQRANAPSRRVVTASTPASPARIDSGE
jgi:hypothetical protein